MDAKIKALWVDMLRNSTLPQARNQLKSDEGYCCLGVLAHCLLEHGLVPEDQEIVEHAQRITWRFKNDLTGMTTTSLPSLVGEDGFMVVTEEGEQVLAMGLNLGQVKHLINMNDNYRDNFATIATWIEENL